MSKTNLFIPKIIKVGFQRRRDTYSGKLAYVIYIDEFGKIRKETSWNNWRYTKENPRRGVNKDEDNSDLESIEIPNEPTEGFVLNRNVGGHGGSSWNSRKAYCRVFDPRNNGIEFEIDISDLMYILKTAGCLKGGELPGKFVYAWDGKDIVILPVNSPEYRDAMTYSESRFNRRNFKLADMIPGYTYKTAEFEDWVYLGRFDYFESYKYSDNFGKKKGRRYFFMRDRTALESIVSLSKKIIAVSIPEVDVEYAEMMDRLESELSYCPHDESKDQYAKVDIIDILDEISLNNIGHFPTLYLDDKGSVYIDIGISGWRGLSIRIRSTNSNITMGYTRGIPKSNLLEQLGRRSVYRKVRFNRNGKEIKERYF